MNLATMKIEHFVRELRELGYKIDSDLVVNAANLIESLDCQNEALRAAVEQPDKVIEKVDYWWREIGETDWERCSRFWYDYCQESPECDTKTTPILSSSGEQT